MGRSLNDRTLYILEQGAVVSKKEETLLVTLKGKEVLQVPIKSLGALLLFGKVQITTQAVLALSDSDVAVSFHTKRGQFRSYCSPAYSKNILLRINIYSLSRDQDFCLNFAKKIIISKIKNSISLLQRYHLSGRSSFKFLNKGYLEKILHKINTISSSESLLGLEGQGADLYFQNFRNCFSNSNLFKGRKYFPSPDPVNASLSFGYSMLSREIQSLLMAHGFDPYVGFYHKIKYGRASLAVDLLETYRHIVIDRLVLRLFNKNIFDQNDFELKKPNDCYLKRGNLKRFIEHYENHLNEKKNWYQGKLKSFRDIIRSNVESFKRSIVSEFEYEPYIYQSQKG